MGFQNWQIAQAKKIQSAFIYFNNTASQAALHNAKQFQQLATQSEVVESIPVLKN
jgi:uncharacterized protein YecE (DUF72 family)